MKPNSIMQKVTSYLIELSIVTIGVLIALFLSNLKESNQQKKYHIASIETIKNEVKANYSDLKRVFDKQTKLLDTLNKYSVDKISIFDLFRKAKGLQLSTINNTGLEFYKKNQINSVDFELMSTLLQMRSLSELIESKLEKLMDYVYPNIFADSKESKMMTIMHLRNVLESEDQLLQIYKKYIDENIKTADNDQNE